MNKRSSLKNTPQRSCIVCRRVCDKASLIRLVRTPEGEVEFDPGRRLRGRGAYLCYSPECIERGLGKGKLERELGVSLTPARRENLKKEINIVVLDRR